MRARSAFLLVAFAVFVVGCATEGTGSPAPGLDEPVTLEEMLAVDTTELGRFVADCLARDGWDVTVGPTGDVIADHADDQRDAYAAAADACFKEAIAAGIIPDPQRPPSEELIRYQYDEHLAVHECLETNGYPTTDAPTWERYLSMRQSNQPWRPTLEVFEVAQRTNDMALLEAATRDCPPDS